MHLERRCPAVYYSVHANSPFQTWEVSPFPVAPYRPMPLAIPLGQKARKAAYLIWDIIAWLIDAYNPASY